MKITRLLIRRVVRPYEIVPKVLGLAWVDYCRLEAVYVLIPLNIPARLLYLAWQWARYPFRGWEPPRRGAAPAR